MFLGVLSCMSCQLAGRELLYGADSRPCLPCFPGGRPLVMRVAEGMVRLLCLLCFVVLSYGGAAVAYQLGLQAVADCAVLPCRTCRLWSRFGLFGSAERAIRPCILSLAVLWPRRCHYLLRSFCVCSPVCSLWPSTGRGHLGACAPGGCLSGAVQMQAAGQALMPAPPLCG